MERLDSRDIDVSEISVPIYTEICLPNSSLVQIGKKITDYLYENLRTYMAMRSHLREANETADDLNIKMAPQTQFARQEITLQIHSLNIYHSLLYS